MPSYGGSNGPDGSKKSGDQGQGTRDNDGGQTGGKGIGGGGGKGGISTGGKQVYSGPIGPTKTGDPLGGPNQHFNEQGSGFGGLLDKVFGYKTVGDRVNAYKNNPARAGSGLSPYQAFVPSYPYATPGYVLASFLGAPMSPTGAAMFTPSLLGGIMNNSPPESMAQKIATELGASPGPQVGEAGVGHDWGGKGDNTGNGILNIPPQQAPSTLLPNAQAQPGQQQANLFKKQNYALGLNGVPGPSPYNYQTAWWL